MTAEEIRNRHELRFPAYFIELYTPLNRSRVCSHTGIQVISYFGDYLNATIKARFETIAIFKIYPKK